MRRAIEHVLDRTNRSLVGVGGLSKLHEYRVERRDLPEPATSSLRDPLEFEVDLDRVTTPCGFSYSPDGWHPYKETLLELLAEPDLPYERTALCRFYAGFQPANVQEALLEHVTEPLEPLHRWPVVLPLFKHLWAQTPRRVARILADPSTQKGPRQQFGPQPADFGRVQVERLRRAYESLRTDGYRPAEYPDGALTGYFLVRGDEYRFMVFHGNHRLAAFRELGIDRVVARLHRDHPPVVDEAALSRWTEGPRALFPRPVAEQLFDKLFTEEGRAKAQSLGIV